MESDQEVARLLTQLRGAVRTARELTHEAGNHLALILGYSELLERLSPADAVAAAREIASTAHQLGDLLGRLQRVLSLEESD